MKIIELDALNWNSAGDFFEAILAALGAPDWHGNTIDGLIDSIVWGGINEINPPYIIRISHTEKLDDSTKNCIGTIVSAVRAARAEFRLRRGYDVEVELQVVNP